MAPRARPSPPRRSGGRSRASAPVASAIAASPVRAPASTSGRMDEARANPEGDVATTSSTGRAPAGLGDAGRAAARPLGSAADAVSTSGREAVGTNAPYTSRCSIASRACAASAYRCTSKAPSRAASCSRDRVGRARRAGHAHGQVARLEPRAGPREQDEDQRGDDWHDEDGGRRRPAPGGGVSVAVVAEVARHVHRVREPARPDIRPRPGSPTLSGVRVMLAPDQGCPIRPPRSSGAPRSSARRLTRRGARRGRSGALAVVGEPGIGKTRLLAELAARADAAGSSCCGPAPRARARPAVLGVRRRARRVPRRRSSRAGWSGSTTTSAASSRTVFPALGRRPGEPRARSWTSATAPTARSASCSSRSRRPSRWCWCSTTSTGPTPPRSSCSARCCAARRPRRVLLALGARPRQLPERLAARARARATATATLTPHRARAAHRATKRARCSADAGGRARGDALRGERRQPVLPRAARAARRGRHAAAGRRADARGVEVPPAVAAALDRGARRCSPAARAVARGRRGRGRPVRARAGRGGRRRRRGRGASTRSTSCSRSTWSARPTCRGASASATRSCAAPSTRRRPAAGGWARTSAAPPRSPTRGAAAARAPTTSSARRATGDAAAVAVLREAGRAGAPRAPGTRRAGSAPRCGCCPTTAPAAERVGCCSPRARRWPRPAASSESPRRRCSRASRSRPKRRAGPARPAHRGCARRRAPARPPRRGPRAAAAALERCRTGPPRGRRAACSSSRSTACTAWTTRRCTTWAERALPWRARSSATGRDRSGAAVVDARRAPSPGRSREAEAICAEAGALVDALTDESSPAVWTRPRTSPRPSSTSTATDAAGAHAERAIAVGRATGQGQLFPHLVPTLGTRCG